MRKQIVTIGASAAAVLAAVTVAPSASAGPEPTTPEATRTQAVEGTATPGLVSGISEAADGKDAVSAAKDHLAGHKDRYRIATVDLTAVDTPSPIQAPTEFLAVRQKPCGFPKVIRTSPYSERSISST